MADPVSVVAGVLGITNSVVQASLNLTRILSEIKEAPKAITTISKDVEAFTSILKSLQIALSDEDIRHTIKTYQNISEFVANNLTISLQNCQSVLDQLNSKIQSLKVTSRSRKSWASPENIKWGLKTKGEVRDLQLQLEFTKSTLNSALSTFNTSVKYAYQVNRLADVWAGFAAQDHLSWAGTFQHHWANHSRYSQPPVLKFTFR